MSLKGLFADKSGIYQLVVLLLLLLAGWLIASLLTVTIVASGYGLETDILTQPNLLKGLQFVSVVLIFLFPTLTAAYLFSKQPLKYLSLESFPDLKVLLWIILFMFLLAPAINLTGLLNKEMVFPSFLRGVEEWMRAKETEAEQMTALMLSGSGLPALLINLFVVAVTAGVTEEFFFRGALQKIFGRWTSNHHTVIWVVAFIFGAIHLQFYGLLPRMLLGAFFGYFLYWTKNLWIPVFAHFLNNAFGVIAMSQEGWKENELISGEISPEMLGTYSIWAIIALILLYFSIRKFRREYCKEELEK